MTYTPKFTEDFVKTPSGHVPQTYIKNQILTSVIVSTIQRPGKVESVNYAFDLEAFHMLPQMEKDCFVLTFDESCNVVNGGWFKENEIMKISSVSNDPGERYVFDKCLERYEAFIEKLKVEDYSI